MSKRRIEVLDPFIKKKRYVQRFSASYLQRHALQIVL